MTRTNVVAVLTLLVVVASRAQIRIRNRIPGYCRPSLEMIIRGQRRVVAVGRIVKPNPCVDCMCKPSGRFECCLSKKNAGKVFLYPGSLCTRCKCAELPYKRQFTLPDSFLEQHCFRGNNLMTCETSLCVHPLVADPNCIQVRSERNECCDQCVRSGCFVMMNETMLQVENNQLAIDNIVREGIEMIKMNFGDSIQTGLNGCIQGTCQRPDFMFSGGFVVDNSTCKNTAM